MSRTLTWSYILQIELLLMEIEGNISLIETPCTS